MENHADGCSVSWLRLDDQAVLNPKLAKLTDQERWALLALWSYCARRKNGGVFREDEIRYAIWASQDGPKSVSRAQLRKFQEQGLIVRKGKTGSLLQVKDWAHFQPKDPTAADRQAAYRERNKGRNANRNENVTSRARIPSRPSKDLPPNPRKRGDWRSPEERRTQKFADKLNGVSGWEDLTDTQRHDVIAAYASSTGLRYVRGTHGSAWKIDPLGTDPVPKGSEEIPPEFSGKPSPAAFLEAYFAEAGA